MKDAEHPFFRPLWRRVAVVAVCVLWAGFEFYHGEQFWGMLAGGMAVYGAWIFLLRYRAPVEEIPTSEKDKSDA